MDITYEKLFKIQGWFHTIASFKYHADITVNFNNGNTDDLNTKENAFT